MKHDRIIYAIAGADFLERVRRYSYFVTLLFAVYLGYGAGTGLISLRLGEYRGVYTSAWIGAMVSLVATTFISLVGFYIVKSAIDRDRQTGVGEILATTPISRISYLLGKFLSNFAVLMSMVGVLAVAAVVMQMIAAEDRTFRVGALLLPFLFLTVPAIGLTAAVALTFEAFRWLRGGFGNVLWFFLWSFGIALPGLAGRPQLDPSGLWMVYQSMEPAARAGIPAYKGGFSLTIADRAVRVATGFRWNGVAWGPQIVTWRSIWLAAAVCLVLCSAWAFDRFDPARTRLRSAAKPKPPGSGEPSESAPGFPATRPLVHGPFRLTPLASSTGRLGYWRLLLAELQLALKGFRWWWYVVAGALLIAQLASPFEVSRGPLLTVAWLWPIFAWSALGTRETRFNTGQVLFSCAGILSRQFPAAWLAGVLVAAIAGLGTAVRLVLAGQGAGLLAWAAGALFIPSLALALGVWSGTSKFFEGLYTALWYLGPLNRARGFDFTGDASGPQAARYALLYLVLTMILLAAAFLRRTRLLRGA